MTDNKGTMNYEVLNPWADKDVITQKSLSPRLDSLNNKVIGLFDNGKPCAKPVLTVVEQKLKEYYPSVQFNWYEPKEIHRYHISQTETENKKGFLDWLGKIDGVISASGDCASCTKYLVYESILMEEAGKPVAMLVDNFFERDSKSSASNKGMPGIRAVLGSITSSVASIEDAAAGILPVIDDIVSALTKPLTDEEKSPQQNEIKKTSGIVFRGNIQQVNHFFYKRGWTDGLPIIPPTEEAVAEMMTGTDLEPDYVVSEVIPRMGKATVEKIAINAVMAGALPTYMPVLIAFVKALEDPDLNFGTWEVSTGSWVPFWVINGPIREALNVNSGSGALSPGNIANATIGRAIGLIIKNIGGARKGIEDMGVLGNPGKYTCVLAEDEEGSPWEPLHVENGFEKEDSTISVSFPNSFTQTTIYNFDVRGILATLIYEAKIAKGATFVLPSKMAKKLFEEGWSKTDIRDFIVQNATIPFYRHMNHYRNFVSGEHAHKIKISPINPQDPIPLYNDPKKIQIMVAGGPGNFIGIFSGGMGTEKITTPVKVELPANWEQLVAKYKNMVPRHLME